jgi:hypothetical protein
VKAVAVVGDGGPQGSRAPRALSGEKDDKEKKLVPVRWCEGGPKELGWAKEKGKEGRREWAAGERNRRGQGVGCWVGLRERKERQGPGRRKEEGFYF